MKKIKNPCRVLIGLATGLLLTMSCQEQVLTERKTVDATSEKKGLKENTDARIGGGLCFTFIDPGRFVLGPSGIACEDGWGRCNRTHKECMAWLDPCAFLPCGIEWRNPWIIFDKFRDSPDYFGSIRDESGFEIDPSITVSYFPINDAVLGMQFYEADGYALTDEVLRLRTSIVLDDETVKDNGLGGNVIPAGVYPVIYNKENNTFNAFSSVNTFPLKYESRVVELYPEEFEGALNKLFEESEWKENEQAMVVEHDIEVHTIEPAFEENISGIYLFSTNLNDINLIFKGEPNPQPNIPMPEEIWADEPFMLNKDIAEALQIEPFIVNPKQIYQSFDKENGILRVTILRD